MDDSTFFSTTLGEWIRDCFCSTSSASAEGSPLTFPLTLVNRAEANLRERNGSKFGKEISYERLCDGFTLNQLFRFISSNNNYNFCNSSSDEQIFQEFANLLPYKSCFNTLNSSQHRNMISTKKLSRLSAYCNGTTTNLLDRLRWFHILKRNLQNFYWMNSLYVKSFPDIISIVKLSKAEASGHEMLKLIGLLLGAAVQSEQREIFIERIKSMRPELQHALIAEIQRVTTDGEEVMNLETLQQLAQQHSENNNGNHNGTSDENPLQENDKGINNGEQKEQILTSLIDCMMKERDDYATALLDIVTSNMPQQTEAVNATQRDGECSPSSSSYTNSNTYSDSVVASRGNYDRRRTPSPTNDRIPTSALLTKTTEVMSTSSLTSCATTSAGTSANELNTIAINDVARNVSAVEYAALKAEVRKLRNENEEHEELMMDLQEEMEKRDAHISKLQAERLDLVKDARAAKDYRDEIDCMQHKLIKLERLEAENEKLKSKLAEVHFYKTRVNSLKEDNDLVQQTCRVLEEQLEQCQRKLSNYLEIEGRMIESQANVKSLQLDLAKTREQVEDLLVENGRLERESKEHAQKCLELQRRMDLMVSSNSPRENPPNNNNMLWNTNGTTTTPIQNGSSNGGNSLTDSSLLAQLDACNQTQILELQLENRKLKSQIENMANSTNPAELFELRAELTAAKKSIEACESEKTEITGKYEAEKSARAESDAQQKALQQRLVEAELVADEMKRTTTSLNQEQIDALRTKIVNLEQEAKSKSSEVSSVRDEKSQIETQLDKMRAQQKSARAEIDKLSEALSDAERTRDSLERSRRTLESERTALKLRLDVAEDRINELDKRACEMEGTRQTLAKVEEQLRTKTNELAALESANRKLKEEIECNARKEFELREDLTSERTRIAGLIHRLRSVYASINLNNGDVSGAEANKQINTNGILDNDAQLVATIDEVLMRAFNTTRRESDTLRIQQQMQIRELDDLKRDIEALRKAESELPASGDKYSQILFENKSAKEQVSILQERLRRLQIDEATRCAELQAARREIDELQQKMFAQNRQNAELSNMKVTLRNNQAQEELLRRECVELRTRLDAISIERNNAQHASQALTTINRALANDHDRLQQLHQALSSDYERVKHDANALKQRSKTEKNALESGLRAQFERERVALEEKLADEMAERQRFFQKLVDCEAELAAVSKELMEMRRERSPPSTVYFGTPPPQQHQTESVQQQANELRRLRLLECAQKSTINNLNMTIQQLNNLLTEKDLEIANLRRQIDMLRQYNGEESRSLIRQIELLLIQNQQLHTRSDVFYAEQKELQEKLAQLRRHKEKLEEKIMDQYKAMDSRKIEAKPTFVRRAAKALISKSPGRKASNTSTRTSVRREGASSSNTEESSVYSADETLFASNGGDSNSPIPAPPHMPPPPTSNNNHGLSQQQQQKLQCCQQQQQQQQKQQIAAVTDDQQQGSGGKASALIVTNKCTAYTNNNCTAAPMNGHLSRRDLPLNHVRAQSDSVRSPHSSPYQQQIRQPPPQQLEQQQQFLQQLTRSVVIAAPPSAGPLPAPNFANGFLSSVTAQNSISPTRKNAEFCATPLSNANFDENVEGNNGAHSFALRARNGRMGASLRCTPTNPLAKSASFADRPFPLPLKGILNGEKRLNMNGAIAAASRLVVTDGSIVDVKYNGTERSVDVMKSSTQPFASPYAGVMKTLPLHTRRPSVPELPPRAPSYPLVDTYQNGAIARPPPPPYPQMGTNGARSNPSSNSSSLGSPLNSPLASRLNSGANASENGRLYSAPPPPYPGRNATPVKQSPKVIPSGFFPRETSTPKSAMSNGSADERTSGTRSLANGSGALPLIVTPEGEDRDTIRDTVERQEKVMSYYENVNGTGAAAAVATADQNKISKMKAPSEHGSCEANENRENEFKQTNVERDKLESTVNSGTPENIVKAQTNGKAALWYEYGCV